MKMLENQYLRPQSGTDVTALIVVDLPGHYINFGLIRRITLTYRDVVLLIGCSSHPLVNLIGNSIVSLLAPLDNLTKITPLFPSLVTLPTWVSNDQILIKMTNEANSGVILVKLSDGTSKAPNCRLCNQLCISRIFECIGRHTVLFIFKK